MLTTVYLTLVFFAGVFGTAVATYAIIHKETPGGAPLALLLLGSASWSITEGLSLAAGTYPTTIFWARFRLSTSTILPLAWFLLTIEYTGQDRYLKPLHLVALMIEPIIFTVLMWTNGTYHTMVWNSMDSVRLGGQYLGMTATRGIAFWAHVAYSYLLIFAGAFLLAKLLIRTNKVYRTQSMALLAALAVPLLVNSMFLFGPIPPGFDPTGIAFVASGAIITSAILRHQLLRVMAGVSELGRDEILAEMEDKVFIVDNSKIIIDCNRAGAQAFGKTSEEMIGRQLDEIEPQLEEVLSADGDGFQRVKSIEINGNVRTFDVQLSTIERPYGVPNAKLLSLRDVTRQTQREQQLDVLNRLLRHNLRNEMNVIRGHAEMLEDWADGPRQLHLDQIIETVDTVTHRSEKIGDLTRALDFEESETIDLEMTIRDAVDQVRKEYSDTSIEYESAHQNGLQIQGASSFTVALEELITNGIEHNDSDNPSVTVRVEDDSATDNVAVKVIDNGPGISKQEREVIQRGRETPLEHATGIGVWLVTWIVQTLGGTIDFEVSETGTTVILSLPVEPTQE